MGLALAENKVDAIVMTLEEARQRVIKINPEMNNIRALLLDFHEREGWKALGYASWLECVKTEFQQSKAYLYRQLEAAEIEKRIEESEKSPTGDSDPEEDASPFPIPERQLRPLSRLSPSRQREAWAEATQKAASESRPFTVRDVADIVYHLKQETMEFFATFLLIISEPFFK